jgi:NhaA family Na+:H+ antiporter
MAAQSPRPSWGASQELTDRVLHTLERFLHIEAVSGGVLIVAAGLALVWANSPAADSYHALWHAPVTFGVGGITTTQTLHFLVNEGLMTVFFLVAGLEIRRELHEGALSNPRLAALPLAAAVGGVVAPALIYLGFNPDADVRQGWAVPIATDIAFALGVLALLGHSIPRGVRVLLLALAIVDDIVAVVIVATFYSGELRIEGAAVAALALAVVLLFQRLGIRAAVAYVIPASILWYGLWRLGVHPTLAGVVLGLLTPVAPLADRGRVAAFASWLYDAAQRARGPQAYDEELVDSFRRIQVAQRDLTPPVVTVQTALHPWVAYGVLPLFAFANAGVTITATDLGTEISQSIFYGICFGLLLGKPLGILLASAATIRLGWCELPADVGWRGLGLVAFLGGIGFTMAIFIANLAFDSATILATAKISILTASLLSAVFALAIGKLCFAGQRRTPLAAGVVTKRGVE